MAAKRCNKNQNKLNREYFYLTCHIFHPFQDVSNNFAKNQYINSWFLKIDITEEEINKRIEQIESLDIDPALQKFMLEAMDALISIDRIFNKKMEKTPKA